MHGAFGCAKPVLTAGGEQPGCNLAKSPDVVRGQAQSAAPAVFHLHPGKVGETRPEHPVVVPGNVGKALFGDFLSGIEAEAIADDQPVTTGAADPAHGGANRVGGGEVPDRVTAQARDFVGRHRPGHAAVGEDVHETALEEAEVVDQAIDGENDPRRSDRAHGCARAPAAALGRQRSHW